MPQTTSLPDHHGVTPRWAAAVLAAFCACAHGAVPEPPTQAVEVVGQRVQSSKEEHDYRGMLKAMQMFEAYQHQHPDARLRFRVAQRREAGDLPPLTLRLVSDTASLPIALDADQGFTLPTSPEMRDADAVVRSNWPSGSLAWWVEVTREGGDPQHRFLGDLRQECTLDLNAAELVRGIKAPPYHALKALGDPCAFKVVGYVTYAERPVFAVHLRDGDKTTSLTSYELHGGDFPSALYPLQDWPYLLRDRTYRVRNADLAWPDETVVSIEYAEGQTP